MILPIIGQHCVVNYRGKDHLGYVTNWYTNYKDEYVITVYSGQYGLGIDYKPEDVKLLPVVFDDGSRYDAHEAYRKHFGEAEAVKEESKTTNRETTRRRLSRSIKK